MKRYFDNFNLAKGYTREIIEYISIGKHTIKKEIVRKDGVVTRKEWQHEINTSGAPYPSFACSIGAASCALTHKKLFPIFWSFLKGILR